MCDTTTDSARLLTASHQIDNLLKKDPQQLEKYVQWQLDILPRGCIAESCQKYEGSSDISVYSGAEGEDEGSMLAAVYIAQEAVSLLVSESDAVLHDSHTHHSNRDAVSALLLCLAPMFYSVWAARKRHLVEVRQTAERSKYRHLLLSELCFTTLVLSYHAKVSEAWEHRRWVIEQGNANNISPTFLLTSPQSLWLLQWCADKHLRNYPQWFGFVFSSILVQSQQQENQVEGTHLPLHLCDHLLQEYLPTHPHDLTCIECIVSIVESVLLNQQSQKQKEHQQHCATILCALLSKGHHYIVHFSVQYVSRLLALAVGDKSAPTLPLRKKNPCHSDGANTSDSVFLPSGRVLEGQWQIRRHIMELLNWTTSASGKMNNKNYFLTELVLAELALVDTICTSETVIHTTTHTNTEHRGAVAQLVMPAINHGLCVLNAHTSAI